MMLFLEHHGVEETANRYRVARKTVWKWRKRWDGSPASLEEESRRPKRSPRKQEPWEIKLVRRMRKKYGEDLLLGFQRACQYGYKRSYGCFKRTAVQEIPLKKKPPKRQNKPYQRAEYPGQKVQIDVKYVPSWCVADGNKYYQYTAKDECTRWTYREMYAEHSTDSSRQFLLNLIAHAPFPIREVQTDNGSEFTKRLTASDPNNKTSFELTLELMEIIHHLLRPATPRHNGKVERQHRIDEMRFYDARYQKAMEQQNALSVRLDQQRKHAVKSACLFTAWKSNRWSWKNGTFSYGIFWCRT